MRCVIKNGTHSKRVSEKLNGGGREVLVADPRQLRKIYGQQKRDETVAEFLALAGRLNPRLLYPVEHQGKKAQVAFEVMRTRNALIEMRAELTSHVRGELKNWGVRLPTGNAQEVWRDEYVNQVPMTVRDALLPLVEISAMITERIKSCEEEVQRLAHDEHPEAK